MLAGINNTDSRAQWCMQQGRRIEYEYSGDNLVAENYFDNDLYIFSIVYNYDSNNNLLSMNYAKNDNSNNITIN